MPDLIGPHLLGRKAKPDSRDIPMSAALKVKSHSGFKGFLRALWEFFLSLFDKPVPPPLPPIGEKVWQLDSVMDQEDTPHCVGFSWAAWENSDPIMAWHENERGHINYYLCKIIDGEPHEENGSYVRSGATVMRDRGQIESYVFASHVEEIKQWVLNYGPVVCGTDWYDDMFWPDRNGFVSPGGEVAGGHAYILIGYNSDTDVFLFQNSWGNSWGDNGRFRMTAFDFARLLDRWGEACAGSEISVVKLRKLSGLA